MIFALVNLANHRVSHGRRARRVLSLVGFLLCSASLVILLGQQYAHNLGGAAAGSGLIAVAYALEWTYKRAVAPRRRTSGGAS